MDTCTDYFEWELKQKIRFWDDFLITESEPLNEKSTFDFIKKVIMESSEKIYCKRRALQELLVLVFQGKIKTRRLIGLLLDEWEEVQEVSLECLRLKFISIFYQHEADDIKNVLKEKLDDASSEIKSEANYQLGLIKLFEANDSYTKEEYTIKIGDAERLFETAEANEENRIDAEILKSICRYLIERFAVI